MNMLLARFLSPEEAMRTIIFVPAFLVSWQLTKRDPRHALWMVAFLLSPQVVKNHIIHLRQGVALSVFVLGYFAESKAARYTLMAAACLIHSSFFFICIIGVAVWFLAIARFSPRAQVAVLLVSFATAGAFIEFFLGGLSALAGEFGARQAFTYADADLDISGIGFVFWSLIFLLFAFSQEEFVAKSAFAISILAFYLAAYFFTPVAGRIFESGMFLVFLAGLALAPVQRLAFLSAFILLACVQYYLRLGEPWLGFGIW
ncbi:MAG: hypothetical protein V2J51_05925 [Erythrobacter sp.]|nr:hypothetical protein [Erythrobacter sp.]